MRHRLLVVDDQAGVRKLLHEAFKDEDYEIELAASGQEALKIVRTSRPDIILLDMKMPGMNGLEALQEIKEIDRGIEVIVMTAYGELELVAQVMKLGVQQHITKPFDINELKAMVANTVRRSLREEVAEPVS